MSVAGALACTSAAAPDRPAEPTGGSSGSDAHVAATAERNKPYEIRLPSHRMKSDGLGKPWENLFPPSGAAVSRGTRLPARVHAIVQLQEPPSLAEKAELASAGVKLLHPLSARTYLASVERVPGKALEDLTTVRWTGALTLEDKLAPPLAAKPTSTSTSTSLVLKLFPDADVEALRTTLAGLGGTVLGVAPGAHVVTVTLPAGKTSEVAALDDVRWIEPLPPPGQPESDRVRAYVGATVGAIAAGDPNGNGVTVGVFDGTHANTTHADLTGRTTQGDIGSFGAGGHATMTAGMIAGSGAASLGQGAASSNQWRGFAPGATVMTYSFGNTVPGVTDSITNYLNDITDAVTADNVVIANNSWGDAGCATLPYGAYVGRAPFLDGVVHGDLGRPVTVIFSAGNERDGFGGTNDTSCLTDTAAPFNNYGTMNHPKGAKNVLAVGAVDSANDAMTAYSSWGPTLDGRLKPEIVAGGHHNGTATAGITDITNAFGMPTGASNQQDYRAPFFPTTSFVYGWFSQTSSAAAEASGAAALLVDAWRTTFPGRPDPLPSTVRALLVHNARDLDDGTTWYNRGPDYASGYGVMRVNETIASLRRREAIENVVDPGARKSFFLTIPAGATQVKVTLAWDDPPAVDGANPALLNDLDLVVTAPDGVRHFPWTLDPAHPAQTAVRTAENHLDNLEQVLVDSGVVAGTWQVEVVSPSSAVGPQTFSVVGENGPVRRPIDLVMALDTSGSMASLPPGATSGPRKIDLLQQAATLVLETWKLHAVPDDRAGILSFNTDVSTAPAGSSILQPFTPNANALITAAGGLNAAGCTALGGALQVGFDAFSPTSTNKRVMLLFSDGEQTVNPYIDQVGSPSRLQIRSLSSSALVPFGGYACQSGPALGPGGTAILPDGRNIDQHQTEIHTIGVGVQGAPFQQLISRLADETHGLHHFTSTPDVNLDLFYTNELVRALKSNTLEIVATDAGTMGGTVQSTRDLTFPVNRTVGSITVALSWRGELKQQAVQATVTGPSGAVLTPDVIKQQDYFTLLRFDLPGRGGAKPGLWRLRLQRAATPNVKHQVSVLAEESCFKFDFRLAPGTGVAGNGLRFEGHVDTWGRRPSKPLTVQATIGRPLVSSGKLLSTWVPTTKAWKTTFGDPGYKEPLVPMQILGAALDELQRTPAFLDAAAKRDGVTVTLVDNGDTKAGDPVAGDGNYAALLPTLFSAGAYDIVWNVAGSSVCGDVTRQEQATFNVLPGAVIPGKTPVIQVAVPANKTTSIVVTPTNGQGDPLGPGYAPRISIKSASNKNRGGVVDHLDGSYVQSVDGDIQPGTPLEIVVDGVKWIVNDPKK